MGEVADGDLLGQSWQVAERQANYRMHGILRARFTRDLARIEQSEPGDSLEQDALAGRGKSAALLLRQSLKVFDELAERYSGRAGGYTRLVKLGPRNGDGAPMVQLELV